MAGLTFRLMSVATANPGTAFGVLRSGDCLLLAHVASGGLLFGQGLLLRLVVVEVVVDQVSILEVAKPATVLTALSAHLLAVAHGREEVVRRQLGLVRRLAQSWVALLGARSLVNAHYEGLIEHLWLRIQSSLLLQIVVLVNKHVFRATDERSCLELRVRLVGAGHR